MYDVNDAETFEHLRRWLSEVRMYASPNAVVLVVGNKADKPGQVRCGFKCDLKDS